MGKFGGLVEKNVLHHQTFERGQRRFNMVGIGIGVSDVFALHIEPTERSVERRIEHVGDAQARFMIERDTPLFFKQATDRVVGNMAIARQLVRERTHIACALHIVLAAQRIDADASAPDVASGHGQVGNTHHRGGTLAMLGYAEAVIDRAIAAGGIQARSRSHFGRRYTGYGFHDLRRIFW